MTPSEYRPLLDSDDRWTAESEDEYAARMASLLPNFPPDVLGQWFYDHWGQINEYEELNYPTLSFTRKSWPAARIPRDGFGRDDSVQIDLSHLRHGIRAPRIDRLRSYFESHGTWPRPVIFLRNHDPFRLQRGDVPYGHPYHLIEGHHRMAFFLFFYGSETLAPHHDVWIVEQPADV